MAPPTRTPRGTWIDEGLRVLAAGGPDAVRIEPLAQALGVTRGGFYWHFHDRRALLDAVRIEPLAQALGVTRGGFYWHFHDRRALLDAMLDAWERRSTDDVIERVEREGGDPGEKARRAGALTFGGGLLPIDLAIRDWARRDPAVAERLRRVDNRRMAYLREQLATYCADEDELEARCLIAFSVAIGHHFIAADHAGRSRAEVVDRVAAGLLAPPA